MVKGQRGGDVAPCALLPHVTSRTMVAPSALAAALVFFMLTRSMLALSWNKAATTGHTSFHDSPLCLANSASNSAMRGSYTELEALR